MIVSSQHASESVWTEQKRSPLCSAVSSSGMPAALSLLLMLHAYKMEGLTGPATGKVQETQTQTQCHRGPGMLGVQRTFCRQRHNATAQ